MRKEFNLLRLAIQFYSRIPVGKTYYSEENLTLSLRYFPLVGIVVGAIGAGIFSLLAIPINLPIEIASIFAILAMILTTGALHEDGVADFFDAFGGGYSKKRILEIMKDSHIGVYGVIAIVMLLITKFIFFKSLYTSSLPLIIIAANASSRFMPILMMKYSSYVRGENSKSAHSGNKITNVTLFIALFFALIPMVLMPIYITCGVILCYAIIFVALKYYTEKKIGGFTGDVLGTLQQFCEIGFYLICAIRLYCLYF